MKYLIDKWRHEANDLEADIEAGASQYLGARAIITVNRLHARELEQVWHDQDHGNSFRDGCPHCAQEFKDYS